MTQITSSMAVGGTGAPTQPKPARVWEEVVMGNDAQVGVLHGAQLALQQDGLVPSFTAWCRKVTASPT